MSFTEEQWYAEATARQQECIDLARQLAEQNRIQGKLIAALQNLVRADNCGYLRETMRYEGYFDRAREALLEATGQPY